MGPKTRHDLHGSCTTLVDVTGPGEAITRNELPTMRAALGPRIYLQDKLLLKEEELQNLMMKEIRRKLAESKLTEQLQYRKERPVKMRKLELEFRMSM